MILCQRLDLRSIESSSFSSLAFSQWQRASRPLGKAGPKKETVRRGQIETWSQQSSLNTMAMVNILVQYQLLIRLPVSVASCSIMFKVFERQKR